MSTRPVRRLTPWLLAALLLLPAAAGAVTPPLELVRSTAQAMLTRIEREREELQRKPGTIDRLVIEIVLPHFDFESMARAVLGKHWRQATAEQQAKFINEFRLLLVRTYATALLEYSGQPIDYLPLPPGNLGSDITVRTEIQQPGGLPIPINYRMELQPSGWKVYDVAIDGVSLVGNYRTTFSGEIRNGGLETLIKNMARRNSEAHGG